MEAPAPDLEIRPAPTFTRIDDPAALAAAVERLRGLGSASIGLSVIAAPDESDEPRQRRAAFLALAPVSDGADEIPLLIDVARVGDVRPLLAWLAADGGPYVVLHDAQLAMHHLAVAAGELADPVWAPARWGSTHIAATLLAQGSGKGPATLDDCVARVLSQRLAAAPNEQPRRMDVDPIPGAVAAAEVLVPLLRAMTPMLRRLELGRIHDLECRLVPAVVAMERAGMPVDAAAFQRIADDWSRERRSVSEPDRIARLDKLLSTYAHWPRDFMIGDRVHGRFHPLAADSGRLSCTDPNLQQIPAEHTAPGLRACFRAPAGHTLVVADYAQIELRVAAHLAPCDALRAVFREGRDPHRATAATITGKAEPEITDHERKLAKAVNFGFLFGMGAERFREYAASGYGVTLDAQQANEARAAFLRTFPGIAAWHRRVGALGRGSHETITVRTAMGRRKRFAAGRFSFNAALNIPVQGTAAEGFKLAMADLLPALRRLGARGVLSVHDEYVAETAEAAAEAVRDAVVETMRNAMSRVVPSVPIEVDAEITPHWH